MKKLTKGELAALVKNAGIKRRVQQELRFVPDEITDWEDRDFIAITNRSRSEGVLVALLDAQYVVPFRLQRRKPNASGRTEAIICDICMTWQRGSNSAVISFQRDRSSISFLCCADLLCSLHVRDKTAQALISRTQLRETNTEHDRIMRIWSSLQRILKEAHTSPRN